MHGFGAPGDDLASLWRVIDAPAGTRFVFPEAPLAPPELGGGRAWWKIDLEAIQRSIAYGKPRDLSGETPEGLAEARAAVVAMLDDVDRSLRPSKVALGGFSQGAMLACDVALQTERPLAALVLLSGTYLTKDEWDPLMGRRRGLPVFLSHGAADGMLPFSQSDRLRDALTGAGLAVTWVPFRGGHEIPSPVVAALGPFLRAALG
jgi:phospholipase/carboxylesterase